MLDTYRYKVDFSEVKNHFEIHDVLKRDLDFPDYYGGNLYALWDCLTDQLLSGITHIEIFRIDKIKKYDNYDNKLMDVFSKAKHAYDNKYSDRFFVTVIHSDGTREEIE